jgi:tetratricopeptide (TPR) repeat protein
MPDAWPHIDRADVLIAQQRFDLAIAELRSAIAIDPENDTAFQMLAICLGETGSRVEAESAARRAVELDPDDDGNHYALAMALLHRNKPKEALAAAQRALDLDPADECNWFAIAAVHMMENRSREALDAAEKGLAIDPLYAGLRNIRDRALAAMGRPAAADEIRRTLADDPESDMAHANLGWSLLSQGKPAEALPHFQEALRIDPTSEYARSGLLEALKARSWIYRPILAYNSFLRRFSITQQLWLVGGYIAFMIISKRLAASVPSTAPAVHITRGLLYAFFFFVFFGDSLINLVLRLDPQGKRALTPRQSRFAVAMGLVGIPTIAALAGWGLFQTRPWIRAVVVIPPSSSSSPSSPKPPTARPAPPAPASSRSPPSRPRFSLSTSSFIPSD